MIGLVIGSGSGVNEDISAAKEIIPTFDLTIAVNQIGIYTEDINIWASLHPENFARWILERKKLGFKIPKLASFSDRIKSGAKVRTYIDIIPDSIDIRGSSGLFAARLALQLGCKKVILAGIPMTKTPHFNDEVDWDEVDIFRSHWTSSQDELFGKVFSMSGWTRDLLSSPLTSLF